MQEHPFAQYIRLLGKGRKGSRSLTEAEAFDAMGMILSSEGAPEQLGAFLMLLRVKEETPEEIAGLVRAAKQVINVPEPSARVDLDWSSYAGKRRQLPWFILSTLALAGQGVRVFIHGASGHTAARIYTHDAFLRLGLPIAHTLDEAARHLDQHHISYLDLAQLCPRLQEIMDLRPLLGLRSPVHTLARMLNPFNAPCSMQSIFHPGYQAIHQHAGRLLRQAHLAVIKGEGGEVERNPDLVCRVYELHEGHCHEEEWPALFGRRHIKPEQLDLQELADVWSGKSSNEYAIGAITGTLAITLKMMGRAASQAQAQQAAEDLWAGRRKDLLS